MGEGVGPDSCDHLRAANNYFQEQSDRKEIVMHLQGFLKIHLPQVVKTNRMDMKAENPTFSFSRIVNVKVPRNASRISDLKRTLEDKNTMHDFLSTEIQRCIFLFHFPTFRLLKKLNCFF